MAAIRRLLLSSNLYVIVVIKRNTRTIPADNPETILLSTPNCDCGFGRMYKGPVELDPMYGAPLIFTHMKPDNITIINDYAKI